MGGEAPLRPSWLRACLLILFRATYFPKFGFLFDVQTLCCNPDCDKLKSMFENKGVSYSSDVEGKQLYEEILHCKMQYQVVQRKIFASWRDPDIHSWIWWWKRISKSSNCFPNNADHGGIYFKLRETDSFIPLSLSESGQIVDPSFDDYRKQWCRRWRCRCNRTPKSFDLSKIRTKSLKKSWISGQKWCPTLLYLKKWCPTFAENTRRHFLMVTSEKVFMMFVGGNLQVKVGQKLFGQFWVNRARILCTPKNLPAPTPMIV